ncbi:MAG: glycosyltransferase family 4 protein, partial [bacterium]|nr:glycosyltransferase family 4 protein [bacterium]
MKLALVHDWLKNISGAERVLIELHKIFPDAPIYTLFYDKKFARKWLPDADIRASFLQKIPLITKFYWLFAWLMPTAIESFDLSEFDRVLSSSVIFSKGLILKPSTKHICYCYSPTRFLWDRNYESQNINHKSWLKLIFNHLLRLWDRAASDRVDQFVAISKVVQSRIKKYYRRDSIVIYPPISLPTESALRNRESSIFNLKIGTPFYL